MVTLDDIGLYRDSQNIVYCPHLRPYIILRQIGGFGRCGCTSQCRPVCIRYAILFSTAKSEVTLQKRKLKIMTENRCCHLWWNILMLFRLSIVSVISNLSKSIKYDLCSDISHHFYKILTHSGGASYFLFQFPFPNVYKLCFINVYKL